ncbi:MAG TPA: hypothetical protein VGL91_09015 [Acidobacteriota bacterium]
MRRVKALRVHACRREGLEPEGRFRWLATYWNRAVVGTLTVARSGRWSDQAGLIQTLRIGRMIQTQSHYRPFPLLNQEADHDVPFLQHSNGKGRFLRQEPNSAFQVPEVRKAIL